MSHVTQCRLVPSLRRLQRVPGRAAAHRACRRHIFRGIRCAVQREDCIGETVALAWQWFVRLMRRGKDATQFVSALASLAAKSVYAGRRLAGATRSNDVLSAVAQRRHGFTVASLPPSARASHTHLYRAPHSQDLQDTYEERLHDNAVTPVPDQVQFRIDWPAFLATLCERDRRLAAFLSWGHSGKRAARQFGLSSGRVTQLRQRWCRDWRTFQGEERQAKVGA